jgi:hypothetical protein
MSPVELVSLCLSLHKLIAYHHLLHLVADTHACDLLQVLQTSQNLVLDLELCLHAECSALLDGEWLLLEGLKGTGRLEVDDNVGAALDLETERVDDAFAGVVGVGDVLALAKTKGSLPLVQSLVVLVCCEDLAAAMVWISGSRVGLLTQVLVLIECLLLTNLEALGLLCVEIVVLVGHSC